MRGEEQRGGEDKYEEDEDERFDDDEEEEEEEELVGDVSLGMKLSLLGGRVIVQSLNPLSDGRASPAQLTGTIKRGDVLLAIDGRSLVHLGIDELMEGLKPLSAAEPPPPPPRGLLRETSTTFGGIDLGAKSSLAVSAAAAEAAGVDRRPKFRRELRLRFAVGEGLPFLAKEQRRENRRAGTGGKESSADAGGDAAGGVADDLSMAQFVPMVDSLSGMPLFHDHGGVGGVTRKGKKDKGDSAAESREEKDDDAAGAALSTEGSARTKALASPYPVGEAASMGSIPLSPAALSGTAKATLRMNQEIASQVAYQRRRDRRLHTSLFFALDEKWPVLLRSASGGGIGDLARFDEDDEDGTGLGRRRRNDLPSPAKFVTRRELMERGRIGLAGAKALCDQMEKAAEEAEEEEARRRRGRGEAVVRGGHRRSAENPASSSSDEESEEGYGSDADSAAALSGGEFEGEDDQDSREDDRMLLKNAAYDDMWRERIIFNLKGAVLRSDAGEEKRGSGSAVAVSKKRKSAARRDTLTASLLGGDDAAVGSEMQSLFFGEGVSTMMRKKKSLALPPQQLTGTLFDLASRIAITTSDRVNVGSGGGGRTTLSSRLNQQVILATRFILDDALPTWLATFRPLKWQQRRVLWPLAHDEGRKEHDMTMSIASSSLSTGWGTPNTRKKLQEQIEEMELDVELRTETCYLVTFYFTRKIISDFTANKRLSGEDESSLKKRKESSSEFLQKYGSYLKLHTSLSCAAEAEADVLVDILLNMAKYDLRHREFLKALSKKTLLLYEPAMLSALLVHLMEVSKEANRAEQGRLLPLLVSAFPDMQPWQVRKAAFLGPSDAASSSGEEKQIFSDFYYSYLSYLLDPEEGNDSARRDPGLVEEWCKLSVSDHHFNDMSGGTFDMLKYFRMVASKKSDDWTLYHRDLPLLMDLSMEIGDFELASDLAAEIITHPPYCHNASDLSKALMHLRFIGVSTVQRSDFTDRPSLDVLRRTILIFNMMATSRSELARKAISMPAELNRLLEACANMDTVSKRTTEHEKAFVALISETAAPEDVITTLAVWNRSNIASATVMPALRSSLAWGARVGVQKEISGALLRIRQARGHDRRAILKEANEWLRYSGRRQTLSDVADGRIWQKLVSGDAAIQK